MKKKKVTILIVGSGNKTVSKKRISGYLLIHWKKFVALAAMVIVFLSVCIGYLISDRSRQIDIQVSLKNKIHHLHASFAEIDTAAIKDKFNHIDDELRGINDYLKARGIKQSISLPQGGDEDSGFTSAEETGDFYEKYIQKISYNFSHIPLGYPFYGAITSTFGHRENPFNGEGIETHKGLDIRAPMGSPVKAMAKGTVSFTGRRGGYGNCIILRHIDGYETLYGHLSKILVRPGQSIDIGQEIGKVGSTGRSTGPHLHYEIMRNGQKINPQPFLTLN